MNVTDAQLALDSRCVLGESPVWWDEALWFVDIEGHAVHRFLPGASKHERFGVPGRAGFITPSRAHGWLIAQDATLASFDPLLGEPSMVSGVEDGDGSLRFNDGKCDPRGRLFAGTMHLEARAGEGTLYRFAVGDEAPAAVLRDVTISNGLAWDEQRGVMYYIDTATGGIDRFSWDAETGAISDRSAIARVAGGGPDGMCIDTGGRLWVAVWGAGRVACLDPATGDEVATVRVPCPNVTSCCFGGDGLDELWITTARHGMDAGALAASPSAGGLFVARPGPSGTRASVFGGAG